MSRTRITPQHEADTAGLTAPAPFSSVCTFDAGGDFILVLETNPYLPDQVIAAFLNGFKRHSHAVRILPASVPSALPRGPRGPLANLDTEVRDPLLLAGLHSLLDDCASLLPSTETSAGDRQGPPLPAFIVKVPAAGGKCRHITVHTADGREAASTFVKLPSDWTDAPYEAPLSSAHPTVRSAAERAVRSLYARNRRAHANSNTFQNAFGGFAPTFSKDSHGPIAKWTVNGDDCGIELFLESAHPMDSWQLLRLIEEWLGDHDAPYVEVTLEEPRRSVSALLRGTAPVHFVAWYNTRR